MALEIVYELYKNLGVAWGDSIRWFLWVTDYSKYSIQKPQIIAHTVVEGLKYLCTQSSCPLMRSCIEANAF